MLSTNENNDLCTICNYDSLCTRRSEIHQPIWFCNRFDPINGFQVDNATKDKVDSTFTKNPKDNFIRLKVRGLCSNCKNLTVCMFPKPEEGIWHCDEYE